MSLRYAIHRPDGTWGALAPIEPDDDLDPYAMQEWAYERLTSGLHPGETLIVGWDVCVFCGAPLTDCITRPSARPYCGPACEHAASDDEDGA